MSCLHPCKCIVCTWVVTRYQRCAASVVVPVTNKDCSSCFSKKMKNDLKGKEKKSGIPTIPSSCVPVKHKLSSKEAIVPCCYCIVTPSDQLACYLQNPSVIRLSKRLSHFQWLPMKKCCLMLLIATHMLGLKPTKTMYLTSTTVTMGRKSSSWHVSVSCCNSVLFHCISVFHC